jgi:hypothetical protein
MTTEKTIPDTDVPPFEPEVKAERGPTDPITKHLWRFKRPERSAILMPFVGQEVKIERWYGRVAANGDETYHGTLVAIATTTTGSTADFVILKTVAGQVWAISTAQVAYIELGQPVKPAKQVRAARKAAPAKMDTATAIDPHPRATRGRRKPKEVVDATA